MTPDPLGGDVTNPQSLNRYAYALNNPTTFVDPLGLCGEPTSVTFSGDYSANVTGYPSCDSILSTWGYEWNCMMNISSCPSYNGMSLSMGGGGGGSGSPPPPKPASSGLKQTVCSVLPQGRVTSLNGSVGLVGGQQGSVQQVVNYNNGEVNNFFTGGLQVGWNGGASASVSAGFVYKPNSQFSNSDFSGPFNNVSGSAPEGPGGSVSWASNGVKIVQGGVGVNLIPGPTGNYSYTWTSGPKPGGSIWTNLASPLGLFDLAIYGLRKAGGC